MRWFCLASALNGPPVMLITLEMSFVMASTMLQVMRCKQGRSMSFQLICKTNLFFLFACLASAAYGAEPGKAYIYDAKEPGDNRALVVDIVTRNVEIQDQRSADMNASIGDLGGGFDDCGNEAFFCLTGLLEIIIPKSMPMKQWQYHGLSCQSTARPGSDTFRITCRSPRYRGSPSFTYSLSRGVLSIDSSPAGGARGGFELRGQLGLFSPGNNP